MATFQYPVDVRMEPITHSLREAFQSVPGLVIDPTLEVFEWKVWLDSDPKRIDFLSLSWIEGINDQAIAILIRQLKLFLHIDTTEMEQLSIRLQPTNERSS